MLEKKHHVCDLGSTETVKFSNEDSTESWHINSWYNGTTGVQIKSGGKIELYGLSLKINNVELSDAGTYECRGVSGTRFLTIYVNGEFSIAPVVFHFRIIFVTSHYYYIMQCFLVLNYFVFDDIFERILITFI